MLPGGTDVLLLKIASEIRLDMHIKGGFGVDAFITNNGTSDATGIAWQIHVEGGIFKMINFTEEGSIDVPMGETRTVSTALFLGLGPISVTAKANEVEKTAIGFQVVILSMI